MAANSWQVGDGAFCPQVTGHSSLLGARLGGRGPHRAAGVSQGTWAGRRGAEDAVPRGA